MTATQADRVLAYLRANPRATTMDIQMACRPFISNPRARISDLRARGINIVCEKRADGHEGFRVIEPRPIDKGEQVTLDLTA